ncbi:uncharacterized protein LOC124408685 [Diprion similis]|uniref:uncharacterized protein LOC124408685 n=1 Tax=Diprion similis TaxID=362088 RepID=UPI001EF924E0|nr:uncharacterized protein LOC124408685 [Diprion similis]
MFKYPWILSCFFIAILFLGNAEVIVRVAIEASFRLHIYPQTLDNPSHCTLTNPQNEVTDIPLDYQADNSQEDDQKIVPLGDNQCGARIYDASRTDVGRWSLVLSNETESINESFRIVTVTLEEPVNRTSTAVIGDLTTTILCGPSSMLYCELRDPLGNPATLTSRTRCETIIDVLKATDFGVWTCTVGISGSIEEIYATHTLNIGDRAEEVVIFANDTVSGKMISWQVERIIPAASWCRAFPPKGKSIMVAPGLELEKYVSVETNLAENKCGLLITGEFQEEYHGIWRLEMGLTSGNIIGGFIKMPEGQIPGLNDPNTARNSSDPSKAVEVNVEAGKSFTITCQTQYPAGYCWIKGPQGQDITSTDELTVGRCSHAIDNAISTEHSGNWTCNMAHVNGGHEEHLVTKVNVIDKLYQAINREITARHGDKTIIACKSVLDYPLQYCRFVRPDGVGLGVTPGMEPSERYSYEGDGLDHGYCGLAISSVQAVDIGEWKCVSRSRFRTWEAENSDTCVLQTPEMSVASVIGLTIGAVLLVFVITGALLVRYRRKRSQQSERAMMVEFST